MRSKNTPSMQVPRFCPSCNRQPGGDHESRLCPDCGEALIPRGYCPVCERFLTLAIGVLCPKHDIPLEQAPPPPTEPLAELLHVAWVTVTVTRSRLEAEGIRTFLEGERMGSPAMYGVATRGVKLQVPADQVDEARVILAQKWSLPGDESDDFEDLL
jgi:predicted RNA-binding Zn-ribbon protein involved in translation (DUF1610 family)